MGYKETSTVEGTFFLFIPNQSFVEPFVLEFNGPYMEILDNRFLCSCLIINTVILVHHRNVMNYLYDVQRIQYAKTKSDVVAKADGTFVPRERRKRHEERGQIWSL